MRIARNGPRAQPDHGPHYAANVSITERGVERGVWQVVRSRFGVLSGENQGAASGAGHGADHCGG